MDQGSKTRGLFLVVLIACFVTLTSLTNADRPLVVYTFGRDHGHGVWLFEALSDTSPPITDNTVHLFSAAPLSGNFERVYAAKEDVFSSGTLSFGSSFESLDELLRAVEETPAYDDYTRDGSALGLFVSERDADYIIILWNPRENMESFPKGSALRRLADLIILNLAQEDEAWADFVLKDPKKPTTLPDLPWE